MTGLDPALIDALAAEVHAAYVTTMRARGITSRPSPAGEEEQLAPWDELSEEAKDVDRATVRATLAAAEAAGWVLVPGDGAR